MSPSRKPKVDFSDLAEHDAITLVTNTAVVAKQSGHPVIVRHARIGGQRGILVFMPDYELVAGRVQKVAQEAEPVEAV